MEVAIREHRAPLLHVELFSCESKFIYRPTATKRIAKKLFDWIRFRRTTGRLI